MCFDVTGDLVADVTVAKQGFPSMAIAATYAGPCFNLLVGLGLSTVVAIGKNGHLKLKPRNSNGNIDEKATNTVWCNFGFLLASLLLVLVVVPCSGYKMTRHLGILLIGLYIVYFITAITLEYVN